MLGPEYILFSEFLHKQESCPSLTNVAAKKVHNKTEPYP